MQQYEIGPASRSGPLEHAIADLLDGSGVLSRRDLVRGSCGLVLASSLVGALAACGDEAASPGEVGGTLTSLNWTGYEDPGVTKPFREEHGVTVKASPIATNEEVLTKLRAGQLGSVDVASPGVPYVVPLVQADLVEALDLERLPATSEYIPFMTELLESSDLTINGETFGVPFIWGNDALIYNSRFVTEPPRSWMDLFDPKYQGKIALYDGAQNNYEIWPKVLGYDTAALTQEQLDETTDLLIRLKTEQVRTFTSNLDDVAQQLGTGDIWVVGSAICTCTTAIAESKGFNDVRYAVPAGGGGLTWTDAWVIAKDAPNPDTAYAWIDFLLEAAPQAQLAENLGSATVNQNAIPMIDKKTRSLFPYDQPQLLSQKLPPQAFPPPDAPSGVMTLDDWNKAWTRVRAA